MVKKCSDIFFGIEKLFITFLCVLVLSLTFVSCKRTKHDTVTNSGYNEIVSDSQTQIVDSTEGGESSVETDDSVDESHSAIESEEASSCSQNAPDDPSSSSSETSEDDWTPFF